MEHMTMKQFDFIESLAEELEMHSVTLLTLAREVRGEDSLSRWGDLNKSEASRLIAALLDLKGYGYE